jgi:lipopolysaccharide transport system ATP-binding protein
MNSVIKVENLGKKYIIGHLSKRQPYLSLRDVITEGIRNFGRRLSGDMDSAEVREEFWALKNVSFKVDRGDRIGIIGRNGAGKSTLLKILSRITEPTTGSVRINGRVASLLEVGTGFHPELTGRENIFLNGAILGMSRIEIKKKFDEIVDFAEIEKFLDTPVKRYSSGMYVRLAFAVAAHLEPEILIVDEVLAVGDAQFQKKCLGKMEDVSSKEGRTVLFVSHNMAAIESLCSKSIFLKDGSVNSVGNSKSVISEYLSSNQKSDNSLLESSIHREGIGDVKITGVRIASNTVKTGEQLEVIITYQQITDKPKRVVECGVSIWNEFDIKLISISSLHRNDIDRYPLNGSVKCTIQKFLLVHGTYFINVFVSTGDGIEDYIVHSMRLQVYESDYYGTGRLVDSAWGVMVVDHNWSIL